jgi:hypothetical protein
MNHMWIRLTRKLADFIDGVDVSDRRVGEVFDLPTLDAHLLIAEGWAERFIPRAPATEFDQRQSRAQLTSSIDASEQSLPETLARLRRLREQMGRRHVVEADRRRVEDRIRDELRDARAETINAIQPIMTEAED